MPITRVLSLISALMLGLTSRTDAFGELGHQLVAAIAQDLLTPKTKVQVQAILKAAGGGETPPDLVQISVWADKVRKLRPETASWHYVNLQLNEPAYDPVRAKAPNVVTALDKQGALLGHPNSDRYVREEALKWVVHLVGDLHQPLHVGEDQDKGGNLVQVKVNRRTYRLHEVWDYVLLEKLNQDFDSLHRKLIRELAADPDYLIRNRKGTIIDWVNATHVKAKACYTVHGKMLKKGIKQSLDQDYMQASTVLVLDQIKMAGIRLAVVLNKALDPAGSQNALIVPTLPPPSLPSSTPPLQPNSTSTQNPKSEKYAWSVNSRIYHYSNCADLTRIKRKNLRKGKIPPSHLQLHPNCPSQN